MYRFFDHFCIILLVLYTIENKSMLNPNAQSFCPKHEYYIPIEGKPTLYEFVDPDHNIIRIYNRIEACDWFKKLYEKCEYAQALELYNKTLWSQPLERSLVQCTKQQPCHDHVRCIIHQSYYDVDTLLKHISLNRTIDQITRTRVQEIVQEQIIETISHPQSQKEHLQRVHAFLKYAQQTSITLHTTKVIQEFISKNSLHESIKKPVEDLLSLISIKQNSKQLDQHISDNNVLHTLALIYEAVNDHEQADRYYTAFVTKSNYHVNTSILQSAAHARLRCNKILREEDIAYIFACYPTMYKELMETSPTHWKKSFNIALLLQKSLEKTKILGEDYKNLLTNELHHLKYTAQFPQYWNNTYKEKISTRITDIHIRQSQIRNATHNFFYLKEQSCYKLL